MTGKHLPLHGLRSSVMEKAVLCGSRGPVYRQQPGCAMRITRQPTLRQSRNVTPLERRADPRFLRINVIDDPHLDALALRMSS